MIHGYIVIRKRSGKDGPRFPVKQSVKIGRGIHCDVRIHVQSVSEQHCLLLVEKGKRVCVQNLSATAQTVVNGVSIGKTYLELAHGDVVTVGERSFTWYYDDNSPYHVGDKIPQKKRRKSEADSVQGTQNVAVVKPLYHKRRTLGQFLDVSEWSSSRSLTTESALDLKQEAAAKSPLDKVLKVKTPKNKRTTSNSPSTPINNPPRASRGTPNIVKSVNTPKKQTPVAKTPVKRISAVKTPAKHLSPAGTPSNSQSSIGTPAKQTTFAKTPSKRQSSTGTPAKRLSVAKTPLKRQSSTGTPAKQLSVAKTPGKHQSADRTSVKLTPVTTSPGLKSPALKTPTGKSPATRTPVKKSPALKTPAGKSPALKTPTGKSPATRTPVKKSPVVMTPAGKSPALKTPTGISPASRTPVQKSPALKTPTGKSPTSKTPVKKSPSATTPMVKSPAIKMSSGKSPAKRTPAKKSPVVKSPARKSAKKTPSGKSPRKLLKAPRSALKGSTKKLESTPKSDVRSGAQKRRLSSSPHVALKRMKMDSSKSIESPRRSMSASTLSTVKLVLSSRKTPIIKAVKTPRSSTVKKVNPNRFTPGQAVRSSVKKPRRPLFSEILKKKAVQNANNAVAKKLMLTSKPQSKAVIKKAPRYDLQLEIPKKFHFSSTGHANSPEPIFIGRKVVSTPIVTRKGRKNPLLLTHCAIKDSVDLSGVPEMFKTPGKVQSLPNSELGSSTEKSSGKVNARASIRSSLTPSTTSMTPYAASARKSPKDSPHSRNSSLAASLQVTPQPMRKSSGKSPASRKSPSPLKSPQGVKTPKHSRKSTVKTPASNSGKLSVFRASAIKHQLLLTSTPAPPAQKKSPAGIAFEFSSPQLSGCKSGPQSPASGRKSRLSMVPHSTSYVHSPHASPVKSSLKSSPSRSPQSGEASKNLSVSFDENIHIQMLVPGSKKRSSTTATLDSSISPLSEGPSYAGTPDATTFDFNSIKTPNVPREMFVSSILSSGTSSSGQASGSAKRKGKALRPLENDLSNLHGVRRLMKTPASPAGYVDVKGVKRLLAASCRTPTYLAVEGVKKLFGDAVAGAGNDLSSFVGVRELFASPPSPKAKPTGRYSSKSSPETASEKCSPVAKIQAEVEGKKTPSFSPQKANRGRPRSSNGSSSMSSPHQVESRKGLQLNEEPQVLSDERSHPKTTRRRGRKVTDAPESLSPESKVKAVEEPKTQRRGRKATRTTSPKAQESESQATESPKKRTTRNAAKGLSTNKSVEECTNTRSRRGAKAKTIKEVPKSSPLKDSTQKGSSKRVLETSPPGTPDHSSPVKKRTRRAAAKTAEVQKSPSPAVKPPKRTTNRVMGAEALPIAKNVVESSRRKSSPMTDMPPRRTRKGAASDKCSSVESIKTSSRKRKVVTFDDQATPKKKGKTSVSEDSKKSLTKSSVDVLQEEISPVKNTRAKRTNSRKKLSQDEEASTSKSSKKSSSVPMNVSPRRTRSRK